MKSLRKFTQLLVLVACATPLLANATAVNISRPNDYSYRKNLDPRKSQKLNKVPATTCCTNGGFGNGLNFLSPTGNVNLAQGTYQFGQFESSFNPTFADKWTFSLAGASQVKLTLSDQDPSGSFSNLLDITNLKLELFDQNNQSLGSLTKNAPLNIQLAANGQYSFLVSGKARGILGGFYYGKMEVAPVPIGDSLPMFTAALLMLGWQFRHRVRLV